MDVYCMKGPIFCRYWAGLTRPFKNDEGGDYSFGKTLANTLAVVADGLYPCMIFCGH